jgi:zinc protease
MNKLYNVLLCLLFLVLPACKETKADAPHRFLNIQEVTSKGGIKAWLVEDPAVPIMTMEFAFEGAGAALDPADKQGIAQLASNTMDEGAGDLESHAFQKLLADNTIGFSFESDRDHFYGTVKTLTKSRDLAFKLTALALTKPRFDAEPVERMRQANLTRIRSAMSDPDWMAARLMNDLAFRGHPYEQNSGGTLTTMQNITPDDLRNFVKTRLTKDRLRIAVSGDITAKELGPALDRMFGDLPAGGTLPEVPDTTIQNGGQMILYKKDIPQTIIEIMQPGIGRDHPDYFAYKVMNHILGGPGFTSRLRDEVREKRGLAYGIDSATVLMDHAKGLSISTSTVTEKTAEVLGLIKKEIGNIKLTPVSDKELADAKSYLIGSMPLALTSTKAIAGMMLGLQLENLPSTYLDTLDQKIEAVTKEDILRIAQEVLQPDKLTIALVGKPPADVVPTRIVETLPNVE